jgi:queuine tRNA-ribosyltransferase
MFKILALDGAARLGQLTTRPGTVESPVFMPVVTRCGDHVIGPDEYWRLGAESRQCTAAGAPAAIANSLIASLTPGMSALSACGGLHSFLEMRSVLFTDSGGYQANNGASFEANQTEWGIEFTALWSGEQVCLTPKECMRIQQAIGSDIAMALDDLPPPNASRERCELALARTHRWANECLEHHNDSRQLLFGICQGGAFDDLRLKSAVLIQSLGFDGVAFGGIGIAESSDEKAHAVQTAISEIPQRTMRYAMGIADPLEILELVTCGVDCFDAAIPTIQSRKGILLSAAGPVHLFELEAGKDGCIDAKCDCELCRRFSLTDLQGLRHSNSRLAGELQATHNVRFMTCLMEDIRSAIRENRFAEFKSAFKLRWKNEVDAKRRQHRLKLDAAAQIPIDAPG